MSEVKWIKMSTDIFDDKKIMTIEAMPDGYALLVVWLKLLALAGKENNCGVFMLTDKIAYTDSMLSMIFRMKETTIRLALSAFEGLGMIEIIENTITIPNWSKYQSLDKYELSKIRDKERKAIAREKQRLMITSGKNVDDADLSAECPRNVRGNGSLSISSSNSLSNSESKNVSIECYKRDNKTLNNDIKERRKKQFVPPTLEEVKAYCQQRGNKVDAQRFFDYYESGKWTDREGKPVVNWKQKMIANWEKKAEEQEASRPQTVRPKYKKLD
jgi:predicted phage replisome organizer